MFDRLAPTLPVLLANLVSLGTITVNYRNDLEQLLVMFPQGTAVMSSIIVPRSGIEMPPRSSSGTNTSARPAPSSPLCLRRSAFIY